MGENRAKDMEAILKDLEAKGLRDCIMCRTCTASCPVSCVDGRFSPLKVLRSVLFHGRLDLLKADWLWLCSSCYTCQERCPQGVRVTDIIIALKNLAAGMGLSPQGIQAQMEIISRQGRIYAIDDFDNKKRTKLGLPALPTSCEGVARVFPHGAPSEDKAGS
jgi:heterodisulfide reductase subunit C